MPMDGSFVAVTFVDAGVVTAASSTGTVTVAATSIASYAASTAAILCFNFFWLVLDYEP